MHTWRLHQQASTSLLAVHGKMYTSTTTSPPATAALPQLCYALRLLVTWPHRLYLDYVSRRDYSSSVLDQLYCVRSLRLASSGLHRLYCSYAVHPDAPTFRSTSHWSVALALVVRPVTVSRGSTTRRPDCTGSTAPVPCIRTRRLGARLHFSRSHWLSLCARSLCLAAQLLVVRVAPALLRLCRASGRVISALDFFSAGCTGSHSAPGHYVSRLDYSLSGLHWLYCGYAVHPDAPTFRSTSHWPVALALVVRPVTVSRGSTTCRPDCTGSTAPVLYIRTRRLGARLLFNRSHWLSLCAVSTRLPAAAALLRLAQARRRLLCLAQARRRVLRLRRASGCLGTLCGLSRGSSRRTSSTTPPRAGSSSTTSPTPHVRVPRHIARLVTRLVAPLVVDYSASCRLVVDYFAYAIVWTSLGPLPLWVPGPTTRWAPGTTRLELHGT
jgi:hypothetical protein